LAKGRWLLVHFANALCRAWPFALLCALASTSWLLLERYPQIHPGLPEDAIACAIVACGFLFAARRDQAEAHASTTSAAVGGMLVLVGPTIPSLLSVTHPQPSELTIALALTAVVVAVAAPAWAERDFSPGSLWPGIAGATGLLLAVPMPGLADWRTDVALALAPLATGIGAVLFVRQRRFGAVQTYRALALAAVVFAVVACMQYATQQVTQHVTESFLQRFARNISWPGVALDASFFVLTMLALNRLTAEQYAARYVLVPLLLLVEGAIFVSRALINVRTLLCAALLLAASVALLRSSEEDNAAKSSSTAVE
jgi:hypothetical protein